MNLQNTLALRMISFYENDPKRIQHFMKVHSFAKLIAEEEALDKETQFIVETAALIHDIGIKPAEEKYGSSNGKLQEIEGPLAAHKMLAELGYKEEVIKRVCYLVAHHHTYVDVDGIDYQILIEADFLVNLYEDGLNKKAALTAYDKIFKTNCGKQICHTMFCL
ncbi:MAG: HD domain-containing protein [bacterium]|nr:HD domain-containing protein [bacterium]